MIQRFSNRFSYRSCKQIFRCCSTSVEVTDKTVITFEQLRDDVFQEIRQHEKVAGVKWKRFPYLNKLLQGHRPGELTVITGPTGSGKTTFMSEYSLDLCSQGVTTLWGSFEVRNVRLAKTMLTQFAGKNLENHVNEFPVWADKFSQLPLYFLTFQGPERFNNVLEAMTNATKKYNISHIVIDNLQFMLGIVSSSNSSFDRFWQQDIVIGNFRKFATEHNCHISLVVHPRKEQQDAELSNNSLFGGVKVSQEADNILILQDKRLNTPRGRKFLQVTKNRFSGDLGIFPLEFDRESLSFSKKKQSIVSSKREADGLDSEYEKIDGSQSHRQNFQNKDSLNSSFRSVFKMTN